MTGLLERIDERLGRIEARLDARLAKCGGDDVGAPIDQSKTRLGRRRHCAAVRRLIAAGDGRAFIVGRKHFLTVDAHDEELSRISLAPPAPANDDGGAEQSVYQRALAKALGT